MVWYGLVVRVDADDGVVVVVAVIVVVVDMGAVGKWFGPKWE